VGSKYAHRGKKPKEIKIMSIETRDALRSKVMDTLMSTFPGAQKVVGGVAFLSDVVDEQTGMLFPV
jgi:hypothetical protein